MQILKKINRDTLELGKKQVLRGCRGGAEKAEREREKNENEDRRYMKERKKQVWWFEPKLL